MSPRLRQHNHPEKPCISGFREMACRRKIMSQHFNTATTRVECQGDNLEEESSDVFHIFDKGMRRIAAAHAKIPGLNQNQLDEPVDSI